MISIWDIQPFLNSGILNSISRKFSSNTEYSTPPYSRYGGRQTTSQCPIAIVMMSVQSIVGVFIDACMTGIVFAKFTKPTHRAKTVLFSKNALVTMRNGAFYLLCRVADLRPTHLIESHISGYVVRRQVTEEGEVNEIILFFYNFKNFPLQEFLKHRF